MHGLETDQAQLEKHKKNLLGKLEGFERILGKQQYLSGEVCQIQRSLVPYFSSLKTASTGDRLG